MGTFIQSSKRVVARSAITYTLLELNIATTLAFHIYERAQGTALASVSYQLEKTSGRDVIVMQAWTDISLLSDGFGLYTFDIVYTGAVSDKLQLKFKVVDADGIETFITYNDLAVIA